MRILLLVALVAVAACGQSQNRSVSTEQLSTYDVAEAPPPEAPERSRQAPAAAQIAYTYSFGYRVAADDVAAVQRAHVDAARSWLADMRGRVAQSRLEISYTSQRPAGGGFLQPVRDAFREAGQVLGVSLAALVTFTVALLPWALLLWLLLWTVRRLGWLKRLRWPRRARGQPAESPTPPA
jgi:hypothetical protein